VLSGPNSITGFKSIRTPAYRCGNDSLATEGAVLVHVLDAGLRVGPRYFSTGEAIDGSRIFYNFMRPVTEPGQMALELERARALSYDLIKTYVRLPLAAQRDAIAWAHSQGMHVTGTTTTQPSASAPTGWSISGPPAGWAIRAR